MPEQKPEIDSKPATAPAVPSNEARGILPKEPDPTRPALPPQLEEVVSDAGRAIGVNKTPYKGPLR